MRRAGVAPDGDDAHIRAVAVLSVDVGVRAGVVADQHRTQPRGTPRVGERLDPYLQLFLDGGMCRLTIQNRRSHTSILSRHPLTGSAPSPGPDPSAI